MQAPQIEVLHRNLVFFSISFTYTYIHTQETQTRGRQEFSVGEISVQVESIHSFISFIHFLQNQREEVLKGGLRRVLKMDSHLFLT